MYSPTAKYEMNSKKCCRNWTSTGHFWSL